MTSDAGRDLFFLSTSLAPSLSRSFILSPPPSPHLANTCKQESRGLRSMSIRMLEGRC